MLSEPQMDLESPRDSVLVPAASAPMWPPSRSAGIVPDGAARLSSWTPLPVSLLCGRLGEDGDDLPNELERLGISTLGRLAGLPRDAVADRFGRLGLRALRAGARRGRAAAPETGAGGDRGRARAAGGGLRPAARESARAVDLPPARPRRAARAGRCGRCASPRGWQPAEAGGAQVALRRASADRARLADALLPHLALLPAPAATLRLEAVALGPETGEQLTLSSPEQERRRRITEAVRQTRSAAGADSAAAGARGGSGVASAGAPRGPDAVSEGAPSGARSNPFGEAT